MPSTRPTTVQQRQEMARLANDDDHTYQAVADQTGFSIWTVRKWARQAKKGGWRPW